MRPSGRGPDAMRPVSLEPGVAKYAEGSCLAKFGDTHVLCTASVEERVPPFLRNSGKGWVTAEYGMLPRSTHTRTDREAARGRQSGRTQEIQRLIGRSLRAVTDLAKLGERQIRIDCDVLQADGGTRTAAVTGSYVALHQAVQRLVSAGQLAALPLADSVAAVSCGVVAGHAVLDLDYAEDFAGDDRRQFRADRHRRHRRDPGDRRGRPVRRGAICRDAAARARRHRRADPASARRARPEPCVMARRFDRDRLVIASHNEGKVEEIAALLARFAIGAVSAGALGLPEPEETGDSFEANAVLKATAAASASGLPALADDSGLVVPALGGAPGIYSARWAGPAKDFRLAMARVHRELGDRDRSAFFVAVLALAWPDGGIEWFRGEVVGHLVWPPRGERGFGYDPMFVPGGGGAQTFGEMDPAEKHQISHRARAFAKLAEACFADR